MAEGFHLLEEALRSERDVPVVLAAESVAATVERHVGGLRGSRTIVLADSLFQTHRVHRDQPGRDCAGAAAGMDDGAVFRGQSLVVVLDGLQDPGNAGAMVRAAEAFGATGVMF